MNIINYLNETRKLKRKIFSVLCEDDPKALLTSSSAISNYWEELFQPSILYMNTQTVDIILFDNLCIPKQVYFSVFKLVKQSKRKILPSGRCQLLKLKTEIQVQDENGEFLEIAQNDNIKVFCKKEMLSIVDYALMQGSMLSASYIEDQSDVDGDKMMTTNALEYYKKQSKTNRELLCEDTKEFIKPSLFQQMIYLILLFALPIQSIDLCNEYQTYDTCISSVDSQCKWDPSIQLCKYTTEFQDGCSYYLNRMACVKQLGDSSGNLAICRFTKRCEQVADLNFEECSSHLSKHGCLSILNPQQLCYWDKSTYTCKTAANDDNFSSKFGDTLYSASVCHKIDGYLVMHSSVLWPLLSYKPNLVKESQYQFRYDLNLATGETTPTYESISPKNNYVDTSGTFISYVVGQPLSTTISNIKISDRKREGCIALQIQDDTDFAQLMITTFDKMLYGINHIYCRYLYELTSSPIIAVFTNGGCMRITNSLQLTDSTFINKNNIKCTSVGYKLCTYLKTTKEVCYIPSKTQEYSCQTFDGAMSVSYYACSTKSDQDIYYLCRLNDKCYLDVDTQYCVTIPSLTASDCRKQSTYIIEDNITNDMTNFQYCSPKYKCQTPGLGKWYCQNIPYQCDWNYVRKECQAIYNYQIQTMKCEEATSKYTCSLIPTFDQWCLWLDNDQKCVNTLTNPLFVHFHSFPQSITTNTNLCKNYKSGNYQFNTITRQCVQITDISKYTCSTATNVNKTLCLSLNSCYWNEKQGKCFDYIPSTNCASLLNVSKNVCQTASVTAGQYCIYEYPNCLITNTLKCDTEGMSQSECLSITTKDNYCKWQEDRCQIIPVSYLNTENCYAFQLVNQFVCVAHKFNNQPCAYDSTQKSCYSSKVASTTCSSNLNAYACQMSTAECYFYEGCKTVTDYSFITCEGMFISKAACIKVTKSGENCHFDTSCKKLDYIANDCAALGSDSNSLACRSLAALSTKILDGGVYCEYTTSCVSNTTAMPDCGTTSKINVHRCSGYSTGSCIFDNYQCKQIDSASRLGQHQLSQIICTQANLTVCTQVTSQACQLINQTYSTQLIDKRCSILTTDYTCAQLVSYGTTINARACAQATDSCYYTGTICGTIPAGTYKCSQPGLSKTACLKQTYGECMFYERQCQVANLTIDCTLRNKLACIHSKIKKCQFKNDICIESTDDCDTNDRNTYPVVFAWSVCSASSSDCYGDQGKCTKNTKALACSVPGQSKKVCLSTTSLQLCQFIDQKCEVPSQLDCEFMNSSDECAQNIRGKCVYKNGNCFTQNRIDVCDAYTYTNYIYCRQYNKCIYTDSKCVDQSILLDQIKKQVVTTTSTCSSLKTRVDCLFQLNLKCQYTSSACVDSTVTSCPHLLGNSYSKYTCIQFNNCQFGITRTGGYCFNNPIFGCTDMGQELCLADISDSYKCYWNGTTCQISNHTTCATVVGIQMNYSACLNIASLDSQKCHYQFETSLCKQKDLTASACTDSGNQNNIYCALIVQSSCLLNDLGSGNYSCTIGGTTFDTKLNKYGCINLTTGNYYYDEIGFKCVDASTVLSSLKSCVNLNKNACVATTSQLGFYCRFDNGCYDQEYQAIITSCTDLNQNLCLSVESVECKWNGSACQPAGLGSHTCTVAAGSYSLGVCANGTGTCIAKSDNTGCDTLSQTIKGCEGFGLSRTACLTYAEGKCKWDGYCQTANLETTLCSDTVNQETCQGIITIGQYCQWNGSSCMSVSISQCANAKNQHSCLEVDGEMCIYDTFAQQCNKVLINPQICNTLFNKLACKQVLDENCVWDNGQCKSSTSISACVQIYNQNACFNSSLYCIWDNNQCKTYDTTADTKSIYCKDIPKGSNGTICTYYAKDYCEFNENKCGSTITKWSATVTLKFSDSDGYATTFISGTCSIQQSKEDCVRTKLKDQSCMWNGSACVLVADFNQNCNDTLNEYACLKSTKNCIWNNERCFTDDGQVIQDTSLDNLTDISCDTPDLQQKTCLSITKNPCQYTNQRCSTYPFSFQLQKCSDYTNVNQRVCQLIDHLACAYDSTGYKCVQATSTDTLSRLACITQTLQRAYWNGNECLILSGSFFCDSIYQSNPLSCTSTFESVPCMHNSNSLKCTSTINMSSLKCETPGLNIYACTQLTTEPCTFQNGKCQKFTSYNLPCDQVQSVNPTACAYLTSGQCKYSNTTQSCVQVTSTLPCSTTGLNQIACLLNTSCKWSPDQMKCICGLQNVVNQCSKLLAKADCESNLQCAYQTLGCKPKTCENYSITDCPKEKCYINQYSECRQYTICEDILEINGSQCIKYFVNGYACASAGNRCASYNNYEMICQYTDCLNSNCVMDTTCRARKCSDLSHEPITCAQNSKCIYLNNVCQEFQTCSQYTNDANKCTTMSVNGAPCNFQQSSIYSSDYICTSLPCSVYGNSEALCHGNEIGDFTCYFDSLSQCKSCEQIHDQCTCTDAQGLCSWSNNACSSVACTSFTMQESCLSISRCQWSSTYQSCVLNCNQIVSPEACNNRVGECYYNTLTNYCENGVKQEPDLSVKIDIQIIYGHVVSLYVFLILISL